MPDLRLDRIRFDAKNNEPSPRVLRSKETWISLLNHHTYIYILFLPVIDGIIMDNQ